MGLVRQSHRSWWVPGSPPRWPLDGRFVPLLFTVRLGGLWERCVRLGYGTDFQQHERTGTNWNEPSIRRQDGQTRAQCPESRTLVILNTGGDGLEVHKPSRVAALLLKLLP